MLEDQPQELEAVNRQGESGGSSQSIYVGVGWLAVAAGLLGQALQVGADGPCVVARGRSGAFPIK